MENKKLKLYNLLTLILAFVFLAFSVVSVLMIPLTKFEFGFLSLKPSILKEVFTHTRYYLDNTVISIPHIVLFFAFTALELVLFIIMLVNLIILIVKVFGFLNTKKEYKDRKVAFTKFARKSLLVMSFSTILFVTATNAGAMPVSGKVVTIIFVCLSFIASAVMDVLFDKYLTMDNSTTLDVVLKLGKRVIAFVTTLIMILSINKFHDVFGVFAGNTITADGHSPEALTIVGCVLSCAFYIAITVIALKGFRKYATRGAFSLNKKNPYKRMFVTGILIIVFAIITVGALQFASYGKFISMGRFFKDLSKFMLVPILASISGMIISFDKEKIDNEEAK